MDPMDDLMLAPDQSDPQQLLQTLLSISSAPQAAKTGATASTFPQRRGGLSPSPMPQPMPVAPSGDPTADSGGGTDWRALIRLIAPAIGSLVAGGGHATPHFWSGYLGQQAELDQQRQKQQEQADNRRKAAAEFILNGETDLEKYDDPALLAQHVQALDDAGARAGFTKPGEIIGKGYRVPDSKIGEKNLKELADLVDGTVKAGYDPEQLIAGHAVLTRKNGTTIPFETAYDLVHPRPVGTDNKAMARPAKAAKTEEERFLQQRAKEYGYTSVDDVPTDTQIEWLNDRNTGKRPEKALGSPDQQAIDLKQQMRDAKAKGDTAAFTAAQNKYADIVGALNDLGSAKRKPDNAPAIDIQPGSKEYKVAEDLAFGRLTFQQFRSLYSYSRDVGAKTSIYLKAGDLNPNFNPAQFEMGFKFASNVKVQQQVASVNNVMSGVPDLLKASDAAARMGATALNKVILPGGVAFGGRKYTDFKTAQIAFADELSGALGYGSATDMSREMGFNMTDPAMSPANFRSAVENIILPFVQRKKASMLGPMGPYGTPEMNPAAKDPTPAKTAPSAAPVSYADYLKAKKGGG